MKVVEKAKRFFDKAIIVLMGLAAALIVADTLAISVDIIRRASFGATWTELFELTEYSLVWITFLGAAWLLKNDGHIRVDLLLSRLNPRHRAITNIVTSSICVILLGVIAWFGIKLTLHDYQTSFVVPSVLRPLKWPVEIIIPIGCFLLFIQFLMKVFEHLTSWKVAAKGQQTQSDSTLGGEP